MHDVRLTLGFRLLVLEEVFLTKFFFSYQQVLVIQVSTAQTPPNTYKNVKAHLSILDYFSGSSCAVSLLYYVFDLD